MGNVPQSPLRGAQSPSPPGEAGASSINGVATVLRDRNELAEARLELVVGRVVDPQAQHLEDLVLRAAVHEHDEAEAVARLVLGVELLELGEHRGVVVRPLLGGRPCREPRPLADRRVRVEDLALLVVGDLVHERPRPHERVGLGGEPLDEPRAALEELAQLLGCQLPGSSGGNPGPPTGPLLPPCCHLIWPPGARTPSQLPR